MPTGDGSDNVQGGAGRDRITVEGFGTKSIDGGSGSDTIVFTQQAVVNLYSGVAMRGQDGIDGVDSVSGIEHVITGGADDVIIATDTANTVRSGDGDDWTMTLGGNDSVYAGKGNDTVHAGDGSDTIRGEDGADALYGGHGNDVIWAGHGIDTIRGGAGADELWGNQPLGLASQTPVKDVFVWGEGDIGLDSVRNFSMAHDKLSFLDGFLAGGPKADNLLVFLDGSDAMLAANIDGHGWDFIARFKDVNGIALTNAIEDGSIFDIDTADVGGGGPGGFDLPADAGTIGMGLQFLF